MRIAYLRRPQALGPLRYARNSHGARPLSLSLFSHLSLSLSFSLSTDSFARQHSNKIPRRNLYKLWNAGGGPLCFASFFGACVLVCVFFQQRGLLSCGDILHNWEVEQGWGFGLLPPRETLWMWGVWECYKGLHHGDGERRCNSYTQHGQPYIENEEEPHTHTNFHNIDLEAHMHKSLYSAEMYTRSRHSGLKLLKRALLAPRRICRRRHVIIIRKQRFHKSHYAFDSFGRRRLLLNDLCDKREMLFSRCKPRGGKFIADSIGCAMKIYGIGQRVSAQLAKSSFQRRFACRGWHCVNEANGFF